MNNTNDDSRSLLIKLFTISFVLIVIARSCGSPREGEVKAYTWNREADRLEEVEIYQGDDIPGILNYIFGGWFDPEE